MGKAIEKVNPGRKRSHFLQLITTWRKSSCYIFLGGVSFKVMPSPPQAIPRAATGRVVHLRTTRPFFLAPLLGVIAAWVMI